MVNAKHASSNSGQAITVQNPIHEGQLEVEVHICCMSVSVYLLLLIYYYIYYQPDNSVGLALHHIAAFGRFAPLNDRVEPGLFRPEATLAQALV